MAESTSDVVADPNDERSVEPERERTTGSSRTQKVIAIIGLVMLAVLGMRMFAGGDHGSGQDTRIENQKQEGGGHVPPPGAPDH